MPLDREGGVYLLRHAETTHNQPPKRFQGRLEATLSDAGRRSAERLAPTMTWVERVVSSPAVRCRETLAHLGLDDRPVQFDERLWEIDVGRWSGLACDSVAKTEPAAYQAWRESPQSTRPGDGESLEELRQRCFAAIGEAIKTEKLGRTLVVTHGGPIRTVLLALEGRPDCDFHALSVPNLCIGHLSRDDWADLMTTRRIAATSQI